MRHVIAGCGFLLVLYLPFWWSAPKGSPGEDALAFVFVLIFVAVYGVVAMLAHHLILRSLGATSPVKNI